MLRRSRRLFVEALETRDAPAVVTTTADSGPGSLPYSAMVRWRLD